MRYVACKNGDRETMKRARNHMNLGDEATEKSRKKENHPLSVHSQETQTPVEWETQAHSIISIAEAYKNLMPIGFSPEIHCGCKEQRQRNNTIGK